MEKSSSSKTSDQDKVFELTLCSTQEEETKSYSDKISYPLTSQNPSDRLQDSISSSILGSISEGNGSMIAQKVPNSNSSQPSHSSNLNDKNQALWQATMQNQPDIIRDLLNRSIHEDLTPNTNFKDYHNVTALHIAASEGFVSACEALLDYGLDTEIDPKNVLERTPLHLACIRGHLDVSQLLVRSGANLNAQDFEGNTPLHLAVEQGHLMLTSWILTKNPDLSISNRSGKTAAQCTSSQEIIGMIREFCKRVGLDLPAAKLLKPAEKAKNEPKRIQISEIGEELKEGKIGPNDFDILQILGKGSFGEVFLVKKKKTHQMYAMKVLRKDKIMNQNLIKYAKTERNVLSYVKHPFIVSLNFAFQTPEKLFLLLDYCPFGDLGFQITKEKRFDECRARIYTCEILLALEELHKRDIIFRDLKPDNIVLDEEGHAMLTDFGLSKEGVYDNVMAKSFCGSVAYLAPEMIKRQGHGKSVDWYLLGVLLYEMLVGIPPYFNKNRDQLYANIQSGKLKLPAALATESKNLLKELLKRDPNKRLGAKRDAEEVKEHRYFSGVNWDLVYRRELKPPLPLRPVVTPAYILPGQVYGDLNKKGNELSVPGWTFIGNYK